MMRIGIPIGIQWFFESFAFGLTALFMGWMGTASLAGHEIALNMAAMTFMVPLGISGAASAVVGPTIGRGDMPSARRDAAAAIVCGVGFMCISAVIFMAFPHQLATLYTHEVATVTVAVALIPLAGWFQVFDGLQAVTSGVLRGTGDTRVPAVLHMIAFWGIGIPLGAWLGFRTPLRERGLWIGLVAGLAAAAVLQSLRVIWRMRGAASRGHRPIERAGGSGAALLASSEWPRFPLIASQDTSRRHPSAPVPARAVADAAHCDDLAGARRGALAQRTASPR